jgi:hypothetical protein
MTFQSSFLIRCRLVPLPDGSTSVSYAIQHVQSGAEFRSASLDEINGWMAEQNLRHVKEHLDKPTGENSDAADDIRKEQGE